MPLLTCASVLATTSLAAATTRSDIVIVLSQDLESYLYQEHINCEDSTCLYKASFQKSPLWISDQNGKPILGTDEGYRLESTSLSVLYNLPLKKVRKSTSETGFSFSLNSLREIDDESYPVRQRSIWVLPVGIHASDFNGNFRTDNWLTLGNVIILETENTSTLKANIVIDTINNTSLSTQAGTTLEPQTITPPANTAPDFGKVEVSTRCTSTLDMISRPTCEATYPAILNDVSFSQNSSSLSPAARHLLDQLIHPLKESKNTRFEIGAYTDSKGPKRWNLQLSQNRAETIRQYLIFKGIKPNKLVSEGYGESSPISDNNSAEGRRLNRRIEIKRLMQ